MLRPLQSKVIGNNTRAVMDQDGHIWISLHGHKIVDLTPDGIKVCDAGWFTVTTKDRINQFLRPFNASVYSTGGHGIFSGPNKQLVPWRYNEWIDVSEVTDESPPMTIFDAVGV